MILLRSVLFHHCYRPLKLTLGVVASMILTGPPSAAEIVNVGFDGPELPSLAEEELAKLSTLQTTRLPLILSDVSPDQSTLVVATVDRLSHTDWQVKFLNLNTGELEDSLALEYEVLNPTIPIQWVDNRTIRFVQQSLFGPWEIISLNRDTGIVSHTTVYPTEDEAGEILGVSPDFSRFALRVYEGEEDIIYLVSLRSLDRIEVGRLPEGMDIQAPAWSDNGQQVVVVTHSLEERGLHQRTPFSPTFAHPINQDALGRTPPEENMFLQRSVLKVYDLTQREPLQMELKAIDGQGHLLAGADISPDGDRILVKYLEPGQVVGREHPTYLYPQRSYYQVYDLAGNVIDTITLPALSGPLENSGRFVDSETVVFHATVGTNRHLYSYKVSTGEFNVLPIPDGSVDSEAWRISKDGQMLIYAFSSVIQPPELFSIPLDGSTPPNQITDINGAVAAVNEVQINPVSFETRNGPREGFLIQPAGAVFPPQKTPIVFWQQGGPGLSMTNEFAVEVEMPFNLLPNFGVPVLSVALAGREGFGKDFYRLQADGNNFGQVDIGEGVEIASQLVSQGWSTSDQLGVTGCSYGGYYTAQAIARFPDVFAAANPQCSLLDALIEWQLGYSALLSYMTGRTPMEAPNMYQQISPLYSAGRIEAATMIFHGSDDFLQVDMARNSHDAIDSNGVPVMMYEFEGVGHSIFDIGFQNIAAQLQINFFRDYLVE